MIRIDAKPLEEKAELPGYGIFYLRRLGAGAEADIRQRLDDAKRGIDEVTEKYKSLLEREEKLIKAKDEEGLIALRATSEYKEARQEQDKMSEMLQTAVDFSNKCQLNLWRSDDPEAMKRLLQDFSVDQIRGFYVQVMEQAKHA